MFYSQHGEDFILSKVFNKKSGVFVEVGCIDGIRFSNTFYFEQLGWTGICVEAHNDYIKLLKKNRPNSIIEHCAAGESNEDSLFYANKRGSLSTLDSSKEEEFSKQYGDYFKGFEEQPVQKKRLDTIFNQHNINEIDLLSLDIEGYEVEALQGLDLSEFQPRVMVIESDNKKHEAKLDEILLPHGYTKVMKFCGNIFYVTQDIAIEDFKGISDDVKLFHKGNPIFKENDITLEAYISTVFPKDFFTYLFKKLKGTKCYKSYGYEL